MSDALFLYIDSKTEAKKNLGERIIAEIKNNYVYQTESKHSLVFFDYYTSNSNTFESLSREFCSELFKIDNLNATNIISKLNKISSNLRSQNKFLDNLKESFDSFKSSENKKE